MRSAYQCCSTKTVGGMATGMRPLIAHVLEATVGGTRRHLIDLVRHMDKGRFNLSIVCSTRRDERFVRDIAWMRSVGVKVFVVQMQRRISPIADLISLIIVCAIFKRLRPQIVHAHSSKAGAIGRIAALIAGVPAVVYTPHAFSFMMHECGLKRSLFVQIERLLARFTDVIIAVSNGERQAALMEKIASPKKIRLIENGVDFSLLQPCVNHRMHWRDKWSIPEDAFVIGCVADFRRQKGHRYLIEAMPMVLSLLSNAYLVLVGRGELERQLRALAADKAKGRIVFENSVHDDWSVYSAFDIYALASLYEGMPYTPIEALAFGLPIVLSDVIGNRDVFEACASECGDAIIIGELVEPKSSEALAEAIVRILQDNEMHTEQMRQKRRSTVMARFSVARMVEHTQQLYEELLSGVVK
ncbi:MAG: glycosyltransferase family 4 protein [Armatimonadota bacterium]|nr:glycosyltransferase family 4 protein [Armatimonadota bacterium]MCX7778327.1 glycosyltransferase family 4 protein [Armatimonadota bacterium]MDW8026394.1 glycosyltransferase family 4 protein [Armatimonadota bacterium]